MRDARLKIEADKNSELFSSDSYLFSADSGLFSIFGSYTIYSSKFFTYEDFILLT